MERIDVGTASSPNLIYLMRARLGMTRISRRTAYDLSDEE
jgi:hypothetical protein